MHSTSSARSSRSCVRGRLTCREISIPTLRSATTEFSDTGSPARAETPAEVTFNERKGSGWPAKACCNSPAAIGLRQILAVQMTRRVSGGIVKLDREWTPIRPNCKERSRALIFKASTIGRLRPPGSSPAQGLQRALQVNCALEDTINQGSRRRWCFFPVRRKVVEHAGIGQGATGL